MELKRFNVSFPDLEENLIQFSQIINNILIQFVFNLDEIEIVMDHYFNY